MANRRWMPTWSSRMSSRRSTLVSNHRKGSPSMDLPFMLSPKTDNQVSNYQAADSRSLNEAVREYIRERVVVPVVRRSNYVNVGANEGLTELVVDLAAERHLNGLYLKSVSHACWLVNCRGASLLLYRRRSGECCPALERVSEARDNETARLLSPPKVIENTAKIEDSLALKAATTNMPVNVSASEQRDSPSNVDHVFGKCENCLCLPIRNHKREVVGVMQLVNKKEQDRFNITDEECLSKYLQVAGTELSNAQLLDKLVKGYIANEQTNQLSYEMLEARGDLRKLVPSILSCLTERVPNDRCVLYLIERDVLTNAPIFQEAFHQLSNEEKHVKHILWDRENNTYNCTNCIATNNDLKITPTDSSTDIYAGQTALPEYHKCETAQMAMCCVEMKTTLTVSDSTKDEEYLKEVEDYDSYKANSFINVPLLSANAEVIAVLQLMKKTTQGIAASDVATVESFARYSALCVHNCLISRQLRRMMFKQKVALEILAYHAKPSQEEVDELSTCEIPKGRQFNLYKFEFDDIALSDMDTCMSTVRMFKDLGFPVQFKVPYNVLCHWILSVKKNYRDVIYHNWRHAVNVTQAMFCILTTGRMKKYFSELECFGLLVACMCHDLDHRGTNNSFQTKVDSPIAQLYGSSAMENHHFDQCIMLLSNEENNILKNLGSREYKLIMGQIRECILDTDLEIHAKKKDLIVTIIQQAKVTWMDVQNKHLLMAMMMTAADVSAIYKPWEVQFRIAHQVANEFFHQGDLEQKFLKIKPQPMLDRNQQDKLPIVQLNFLDNICLPVYELLAGVESSLSPMLQGCMKNRIEWNRLGSEYYVEMAARKKTRSRRITQTRAGYA